MSHIAEFIDGSNDLAQQERDLNFAEQARLALLVTYKKTPAKPTNEATLQFLKLDEQPPHFLRLVLKTAQPPAGTDVLFEALIFVKGIETSILVCRQQSSLNSHRATTSTAR